MIGRGACPSAGWGASSAGSASGRPAVGRWWCVCSVRNRRHHGVPRTEPMSASCARVLRLCRWANGDGDADADSAAATQRHEPAGHRVRHQETTPQRQEVRHDVYSRNPLHAAEDPSILDTKISGTRRGTSYGLTSTYDLWTGLELQPRESSLLVTQVCQNLENVKAKLRLTSWPSQKAVISCISLRMSHGYIHAGEDVREIIVHSQYSFMRKVHHSGG